MWPCFAKSPFPPLLQGSYDKCDDPWPDTCPEYWSCDISATKQASPDFPASYILHTRTTAISKLRQCLQSDSSSDDLEHVSSEQHFGHTSEKGTEMLPEPHCAEDLDTLSVANACAQYGVESVSRLTRLLQDLNLLSMGPSLTYTSLVDILFDAGMSGPFFIKWLKSCDVPHQSINLLVKVRANPEFSGQQTLYESLLRSNQWKIFHKAAINLQQDS